MVIKNKKMLMVHWGGEAKGAMLKIVTQTDGIDIIIKQFNVCILELCGITCDAHVSLFLCT